MLTLGETVYNYQILSLLGEGGFGRVWRAKDLTVNGREVAIKELTDPTPEHVEAFLREMELLATLKHPGIVTFHHAMDDGELLVMEYIPEGSLRRLLGKRPTLHPNTRRRATTEEALDIVISLCDVLSAVHAKGIVHRDLKLDNVFLQDRLLRVGDFGIAEVLQDGRKLRTAGTLPYMAPECFNDDFGLADHRTDLYAAGVMLFTLLSGANPFEGNDAGQLVYKICFVNPAIPLDLPRWLQNVLRKALAKSPDLRFQSAADLRQTLEAKVVPQIFPAKLIKANQSFVEADRLLSRGKFSRASAKAELGLKLYPDHPRLLFTQAKGLLVLRRPVEALPLLLRARKLDPGIQCEKELGYAHMENKAYGNAIACLSEYSRRRPDDVTSFSLLMEALYLSGAYEQAKEIGEALSEEDDRFGCNVALAAALAGNPREGVVALQIAAGGTGQLSAIARHNLAVLAAADELQVERFERTLFFAFHPHAILRARQTKQRALRLDIETPRLRPSVHTSDAGFVSVGRQAGMDILLPPKDRQVSRFHGVFYYREGIYYYRDLDSTCGSFLGEVRIKGDIPLMGMEALRIGSSLLKVSY